MARKKKKSRPLETLGAVLVRDKLLKQAVKEVSTPVSTRDWENAVGSRIALRTRPARLDRGMLVVVVTSAAWSNELSLLSAPIIERLQNLGVKVTELRFRVGKVEPDVSMDRRPRKLSPHPVELGKELERSLEAVGDEGLRAALEAAAARSLAFAKGRS